MVRHAQRFAAILFAGSLTFTVSASAATRNASPAVPHFSPRVLQPLHVRPDTFTVDYTFQGGADGSYPYASLIADASGAFYGTTVHGGAGSGGYGTVFKLTPNGSGYTHTILYTFQGGGDGAYPYGGLVRDKAGDLFGTTYTGGSAGPGTVFELVRSHRGYRKQILHNFAGGSDGAVPLAGLYMDSQGSLYGTTGYGGGGGSSGNNGTVFKLTRSGSSYTESVIWAFAAGNSDGSYPNASLIADASGALYGTTANGNKYNTGTVFKLTPTGSTYTESIIYAFQPSPDGSHPFAPLTFDKAGALYGTTQEGGSQNGGTVFKLTPNGSGYSESILYAFTGCGRTLDGDGCVPYSSIVRGLKCKLYGTTLNGGTMGIGTVFELTPHSASLGHECKLAGDYAETTLYSFQGGSDGKNPQSGLLARSGVMYGTAFYGGSGYGTVYGITP